MKSCLFPKWGLTSISLQLHWGTVSCFQGCSSSWIYSSHNSLCFMMFLLCHLQLMSELIPRLMSCFKCLPCRQHPTWIYLFWISSPEQVIIQWVFNPEVLSQTGTKLEAFLFDIPYLFLHSCKGTGSDTFLEWNGGCCIKSISNQIKKSDDFLETQYGQRFDLAIFFFYTPEL